MAASTAFGLIFGERCFANGPGLSGISPMWVAIPSSIYIFLLLGSRLLRNYNRTD
jgi:hypothetical protein